MYIYTKSAEKQKFELPFWADDIPEYVGEFNYAKNSYVNLQPGYL